MTGATLLALRLGRGLSRAELAAELRRVSDEPLTEKSALRQMIWAWETGKHAPSALYMRAYRLVFPGLAAHNPAGAGELSAMAADLTRRAAAMPSPDQVSALEAAALARAPEKADEIREWVAQALGHLEEFHGRLAQIAAALNGEDPQ